MNGSLFSYYVGAGLEYNADPKFGIGANVKIGGSTLSYDGFDYTAVTEVGAVTTTATGTTRSDDTSGLMVGPELKLTYEINPQLDFVGTGNAMFHLLDSDVIEDDTLTTYYVGGGLRFNLNQSALALGES